MTMQEAAADTGYAPTVEEWQSLAEWFRRYDARAADPDVAGMAELGRFPMNLVTDDGAGNAHAEQWDRERYLRVMTEVMGGQHGDIELRSRRTPHFLSSAIAVVFTVASFDLDGQTHTMHYADVLVRVAGDWRFQTMVQAGWAQTLTGGAAPQ